MEIGRTGIWTHWPQIGEENAAEAAALVEELGYGTFWLGFSPRLHSVRPLLEATQRITVGTSIVNVWSYEPAELATEWAALERDFPGRLAVGIGVGHPEATSEYEKPLSAMRRFLDGLDAAAPPLGAGDRMLAALGPRMLELAGGRATGAIPYFTPAEHTAAARQRLGPDSLLAPEMACVLDTDPESARTKARKYARTYLGLRNYTRNLLRHGFTEADIADGGSDRLIDAIVPHGSAEKVAAAARRHLETGADHVAVQPVGMRGIPAEEWRALAATI